MKIIKRITLILVAVFLFAATPTANAQKTFRTVAHSVACVSKANYERLSEMVANGDEKAFKRFLNDKTNQCLIMKGGVQVYVVDQTFTLVKIRPKGQPLTLWTSREGIR